MQKRRVVQLRVDQWTYLTALAEKIQNETGKKVHPAQLVEALVDTLMENSTRMPLEDARTPRRRKK